jgi:adenylate kinase family enzyme
MKKIAIIGCSGSGKSTLAKKLGEKYDIEPIDLDTVRFIGGFTGEKRSTDDFIADLAQIAKRQSWIVEGVYYQYDIVNVLWKNADVVIWLDLPLWLIQIRTWKRSIGRIFSNKTKPSGSSVTWKTEFGKNGLLRVLYKIHKAVRGYYPDLLKKIENDSEIVIIRSSSEYKEFLKSLDR